MTHILDFIFQLLFDSKSTPEETEHTTE